MRATPGARKKGGANEKKKLDYAAVAKGEAPSSPASPTTIAQQRSQWVLKNLTGCTVKVVTKNGTAYEGILQATALEPTGLAIILSHARNLAIVSELPTRPERRVTITAADFAQIEATNVTFMHDAADGSFGANDGFKTDTDISGGQTGAMRELTPWMPDEDVPLPSHLDNTFQKQRGGGGGGGGGGGASGSWDQFATNEKLFGVRTTFNEDLYTTVLDKSSPDFAKMEARATRTANEIIHQVSSTGNFHVLEERGQLQGQDYDEEDLYGAVIRDPAAKGAARGASSDTGASTSPGKNVYIPPAKKQQLASQAANADDRKGSGSKRSNSRAQNAREEEQPSPAAAAAAASASPSSAQAPAAGASNGVATGKAATPSTSPSSSAESQPKATPGSAATPSDTASSPAPTAATTSGGESTLKPAAAAATPATSNSAPSSEPVTPSTLSAVASPAASPAAASPSSTDASKKPSKMSVKAKEFVPSTSTMRVSSHTFQPSYAQPRQVVLPAAIHPPPQQPLLSPQDMDSYGYSRAVHVVPDEQSTSPQWIAGREDRGSYMIAAPGFEPSSPTATAIMYQPGARSPYGQQQLLPPYSFQSPTPMPQTRPPRYYSAYDYVPGYPGAAAPGYYVVSPPGVYPPQPIPMQQQHQPQQPPQQQQQHDSSAGKPTPSE